MLIVLGLVLMPRGWAMKDSFFAYDDYALPSDSWDLPFSIKINLISQTVLAGDSGSKIKVCQPTDEFACFTGKQFYFAVVKSQLAVGRRWELDGVLYEVVEKFDFKVLGLSEPVFRIRSKRSGVRHWEYLYSCARGLVALDEYGSNGRVEHFLLRQSNGFAYGVACKPQ